MHLRAAMFVLVLAVFGVAQGMFRQRAVPVAMMPGQRCRDVVRDHPGREQLEETEPLLTANDYYQHLLLSSWDPPEHSVPSTEPPAMPCAIPAGGHLPPDNHDARPASTSVLTSDIRPTAPLYPNACTVLGCRGHKDLDRELASIDFDAFVEGIVDNGASNTYELDVMRSLHAPAYPTCYTLLKPIGRGAYGTTWKARERRYVLDEYGLLTFVQKDVAVKVQDDSHVSRREALILAYLREADGHPNVVVVLDAFSSPDATKRISVMEFLGGGCLTDILERTPGGFLHEKAALSIWFRVLAGLEYLHRHHIYHGDLNPNNVVLDESGEPKIIDFGLSSQSGNGLVTGHRCTLPYEAPEAGPFAEPYSGGRADLWSAGAMLFFMVFGEHAYPDLPDYACWKHLVRTMRIRFPYRPIASKRLMELLFLILAVDPSTRPSLAHLLGDSWAMSYLGTRPPATGRLVP
ncbi:Protein kinase domain-containing protein [Plasmodiophora brassicae]|uniref:Protein kinase domain-containing protein n=1 Tax=Plasmodiophora brassicae TaxID=37360 RepID=A0A0G4INM9_PLABS|nr:hypothetical protein PBRA_005364 [Plasmodiophora brassicae]SPR00705.1 unnamed protein product [Plasmodiophora brassicae]